MTNDQIQFFAAQEQRRHNLASEEEAKRHNVASEALSDREVNIKDFSAVAQSEYYRGMIQNGAVSAAAAYKQAINGGLSAEAALRQASVALMRVQGDMDYRERELIQKATIDQLNRELKYQLKELDIAHQAQQNELDRLHDRIRDTQRAINDINLESLKQSGAQGRKIADYLVDLSKTMANLTKYAK